MALSVWTDMIGSAAYIMIGDMSGLPNASPGVPWAGRRLVLTTDDNGNLLPMPRPLINNCVIEDAYNILLSGPSNPATTLVTANLLVDTVAGANVFSVAGLIVANGSAGLYSIAWHMTDDDTGLLTPGEYRCSTSILDNLGNEWTPLNGETLIARVNKAV